MERRQLGGSRTAVRFVDEFEEGFGWYDDADSLRRTSHALVVGQAPHDTYVWLVDPIDGEGVDERVRAAGEPAGVVQLLDRHTRDCGRWAERLGVTHHVVPFGGVELAPFTFVRVLDVPKWREAALWWRGPGVLLVADALGTLPYFRARGERIGVHPLLRLWPPKRLVQTDPKRVLVGHGEGVHEDAAAAVRDAITHSRRRLPSALANLARRR